MVGAWFRWSWKRFAALAAATCACALVGPSYGIAQPLGSCRYFVETGHYACDEFLRFFGENGGSVVFGWPVAEAYVDERLGLEVQVFENARMELHPAGPDAVRLTDLVVRLGYGFSPLPPDEAPTFPTAVQRYYAESGHTVSRAFLDFYLDHGGPATFGLPVSETRFERGRTVQYFERVRLEWHPDAEPRPEVRVSPLGAESLDALGVPERVRAPLVAPPEVLSAGGEAEPTVVRELRVAASVGSVVVAPGSPQSLDVYVTDQRGMAVGGAAVTFEVPHAAGAAQYGPVQTDDRGRARIDIGLGDVAAGERVLVDVQATFGTLIGRTKAFCLVWG